MVSPGQFQHPLVRRAKCEIAAAALAHGVVPAHNVTRALDDPAMAYADARRARDDFGFLRMWSIHPAQIAPIVDAMRPEAPEVEHAAAILTAAQDAEWGPLRIDGELHDRASYRQAWTLLQRAHAAGATLPPLAAAFFSPRDGGHLIGSLYSGCNAPNSSLTWRSNIFRKPSMRLQLVFVMTAAAASLALAQDYPKLKSGQWEMTTTNAKAGPGAPPTKSTMCTDDALQKEMISMGAGMRKEMCTKNDFKRDGATITTSSECKIGDSNVVSRAVMTLAGDTGYKTEISAVLRSAVHGDEGFADDTGRQVRRPLPRRHGSRRFRHSRWPEDQHQGHRDGQSADAARPTCSPRKGAAMSHNLHNTLARNSSSLRRETGKFYSLPALEKAGVGKVSRLPVSIRIVLESVLRNCDGKKVTEEHVKELANWSATAERVDEIPFVVARVVLQDFTGVPLLADLAAMRNVANDMGKNPKMIEPLVPVDLVVDHSVMIDHYGTKDALDLNMKLEFARNGERYQFMKWGMQAFDTFGVVPPGIGIVHQVNLEYLARGVHQKDGIYYPDSLVGTDSHTTMVNGIGVVAWGVGGIEAEAGMLGQPVYFLTPGRRRRRAQGQAERRDHRDRSRSHRHRDAPPREGGGQVRRILRRRHGDAFGSGSRDDRQHGARVRRDHGLLPGRPGHRRLSGRHRPDHGGARRVRVVFQGAGAVRHAQGRRDRLHEDAVARPGLDQDVAGGTEASAGPHRARQPRRASSPSSSASRSARTASPSRRPNSTSAS